MSANPPDPLSLADRAGYDEIKTLLDELEPLFDDTTLRRADPDLVEALGERLRHLHALIRVRHAAGFVDNPGCAEMIPPHLIGDQQRLLAEHSNIIGLIDRLVRLVDSVPDRSAEDREVFLLRGRELVAVLRRHEAEEDRLFYLAYWHDSGGGD